MSPRHTVPLVAVLALMPSLALGQGTAGVEPPVPPNSRFAVLFPAGTGMLENSASDDAVRQEALSAVDQSLRALHYQVMLPDEVILGLHEAGVQCERGVYHCRPQKVLEALELDAVVMLALWTDETGPTGVTIEVTLEDRVGQARGHIDGPAKKQVPDLLMRALQDTERGRAVRLQVDTVPTGAEVRIDGEIAGVSPVTTTTRYAPGRHSVTLAKPGYVTTTTHFEIPRGAGDPFAQAAKMDPKGEVAGPVVTDAADEPTAAYDYALGGALGAAAIALAVSPIRTMADSGSCREAPENGMCEEVTFDGRAGLLLTASLIALGGSIYTFVATPIQASLSTDGESFGATVSTSF